MKLSSSLEDYLETIYEIVEEKGAAKPRDIARGRDVAASSVTSALKHLARLGLVNHAPYDLVTLTEEGEQLAKAVTRKHSVLKEFFEKVLEIDEETADSCACGIEHVIPDDVLTRFIAYLKFVEKCGFSGRRWQEGTGFVCNCITHKTEEDDSLEDSVL
ncbi:DtxR family transcriptional regulator [Candidatus Fermentibacteria bacterium]|nr:MAG: DtxR family transcriptional regulator [Candidatus Fermentibacteria bacterium]PIE51907.1 MAG: DtxR family transcriptional regulator [Candidatus Fermentibacteria bacterium]PIE53469.1 MAG: DtxR family transcriptional regulator [Candidatus Fermentibacteria bacterium]